MALVAGLLGVALLMALSPLVACVWCVLWDKYYRKAELVGLETPCTRADSQFYS
eukprot:COSAG01_NODE_829_length_13273_cov_7.729695_10_plen_54_part_00